MLPVRGSGSSHKSILGQRRFPLLAGSEILVWPGRDYRFRLLAPKAVWSQVLKEMAEEQTWSNFKNEAAAQKTHTGIAYISKLHAVWHEMAQLQDRGSSQDRW